MLVYTIYMHVKSKKKEFSFSEWKIYLIDLDMDNLACYKL